MVIVDGNAVAVEENIFFFFLGYLALLLIGDTQEKKL